MQIVEIELGKVIRDEKMQMLATRSMV